MTTIATDGKVLAADTLMVGSYIDQIKVKKIWLDKNNGCLFGGTGDFNLLGKFKTWWLHDRYEKSGLEQGFPKIEDCELLMVKKEGVYFWNQSGISIEVGVPAAIGSGAKFAMGAMLAGATPARAIEIASRLDPYTNSEIIQLDLRMVV